MSYDQHLADRIRERLAGEDAITEKAMFGGIAFFSSGNMAVGVGRDGLMVRVGPGAEADALAQPHARVFDMTGRPMKGWVLVEPAGIESDDRLGEWVARGLSFAGSLPPK